MRVLHVAESIRGGCGTYLNETVPLQIAALGASEVRVLAPLEHVAQLTRIDAASICTFRRPRRSIGLMFLAVKAAQVLRAFRPDVIHLHSTFAGLVIRLLRPILAPAGARSFIVYCPHGWAFDMEIPRVFRAAIARVECWLAWRTDRIVAISQYEFDAGAKIGISPARLELIVNGIADRAETAPAEWNDTRLRVLFVGRMDRQKGFDLLLAAVAGLNEQVAVRAIGAAVHAPGMRCEVPPGIEMLGWRNADEIAAQMRACDVVVVPSRWEGFGLAAIEAMRAGRGVIAARVGGLAEIVVDGVTGRLTPGGDSHALRSALLSATAAEWAEMGRAGRERYLEFYTVDRVHRELTGLYRQSREANHGRSGDESPWRRKNPRGKGGLASMSFQRKNGIGLKAKAKMNLMGKNGMNLIGKDGIALTGNDGTDLMRRDRIGLMEFGRKLAGKVVNYLPTFLRYRAFDHRAQINRRIAGSARNIDGRPAFEHYWRRYGDENRVAVVEYVARTFDGPGREISLLDFGCHCGNMLRLIDEQLQAKIEYLGVDPNVENLAFAFDKFRNSRHRCTFVRGTDETIGELARGKRFDIFLMSSVCYAMSPSQLDRVLIAAGRCARHIVIADDLGRLEARTCTLGGTFLHPYRRLLRRHGFRVEKVEFFTCPQIAYKGFLSARHSSAPRQLLNPRAACGAPVMERTEAEPLPLLITNPGVVIGRPPAKGAAMNREQTGNGQIRNGQIRNG